MKQRGTPAAWKTPERLFRGLFSPGGKCGSGACFYLIIRGAVAPVLPMPLHLWFRGRTVMVFRFYPLSLLP